jgi:hypothetical protein
MHKCINQRRDRQWKQAVPQNTNTLEKAPIKSITNENQGNVHRAAKEFQVQGTDGFTEPYHRKYPCEHDLGLILTCAEGHEQAQNHAEDKRSPEIPILGYRIVFLE